MMGRQSDGQKQLFCSFNLDEHVPPDHLLRGVDHFLDLGDLHQHRAPFYSHTGRPSIDPQLLIRMLVVGYRRVVDSKSDQVAPAQLAVDGEIE